MDVRQKRNKVLGERVVKALESRNMDSGRKYDQYGRCLFRTRMWSD